MEQSPYCLNTRRSAKLVCTLLRTKTKISPKTSEDIAKGGFIELHYILKGLVAPAFKESQSVQINMLKAPFFIILLSRGDT